MPRWNILRCRAHWQNPYDSDQKMTSTTLFKRAMYSSLLHKNKHKKISFCIYIHKNFRILYNWWCNRCWYTSGIANVCTLRDHRKIHHTEVKNITKFYQTNMLQNRIIFSLEKKNQIFMARNYIYIYII